ncbi:hypothetical protein D8B26_004867 [Coccidioides posadasii str. Silveira]|uniref:uncharacterized protein n=1 Tax=Coccidioides posadasii (strain RMSCC 757 / Silveira) TaxID=443226 RepID=UPI001BED9779|nr:hypothetical protein D8B26_004867 [Coccidioides posadasii str. Silveira]
MGSTHAFTEIPLIDLSLAKDPLTRPVLFEQLRYALISVGFLYISNHGVPEKVINDLVNVLPELFDLPESAKEEIALRNSPHFLGYSSVGSETTGGKADKREQAEFATELLAVESKDAPLYERLRGPNQWPPQLPPLRPAVTSYIQELTALGERFLRLVAEALSLPQETFFHFLSDQHRLKLVHYPGASNSPSSGTITQGNGDWIDVPVIPGTFVVNIGQAFEVVTNGVCKATTHRVLMSGYKDRYSVPFFQGVRRNLTKTEAVETLKEHFSRFAAGGESVEAKDIDSAFLRGKYDTWGESQLRTKIRSHRDVGKKFYGDVFDKYVNDD